MKVSSCSLQLSSWERARFEYFSRVHVKEEEVVLLASRYKRTYAPTCTFSSDRLRLSSTLSLPHRLFPSLFSSFSNFILCAYRRSRHEISTLWLYTATAGFCEDLRVALGGLFFWSIVRQARFSFFIFFRFLLFFRLCVFCSFSIKGILFSRTGSFEILDAIQGERVYADGKSDWRFRFISFAFRHVRLKAKCG